MSNEIGEILDAIRKLAKDMRQISVMEVCGTHTANIRRFGIDSILPENLRLVSGPGCPVCVTAQKDVASAVYIAGMKNVIFTCFGDMMRVPSMKGSLYSLKENGHDIRLVTSPLDALQTARENPLKQIVYFGIGFETTAPHTTVLIKKAEKENIKNLSVLCAHKTMPCAVEKLLTGRTGIDALLCPGHVAAVTGSRSFNFIPDKLGIPAAIAGFEAFDILAAILCITALIKQGRNECVNMYPSAVSAEGNRKALDQIYEVLEPCGAIWRGLGYIEGSGLRLRGRYSEFDAAKRYAIPAFSEEEPDACQCAKILRGECGPADCPYFGGACTPDTPVGPCMVSSEGSCAAYYNYGTR